MGYVLTRAFLGCVGVLLNVMGGIESCQWVELVAAQSVPSPFSDGLNTQEAVYIGVLSMHFVSVYDTQGAASSGYKQGDES